MQASSAFITASRAYSSLQNVALFRMRAGFFAARWNGQSQFMRWQRTSDGARGFVILPKRWLVERSYAWLNRCRRLAKDWECLSRKALAFLRLASIRLMLRKLCIQT